MACRRLTCSDSRSSCQLGNRQRTGTSGSSLATVRTSWVLAVQSAAWEDGRGLRGCGRSGKGDLMAPPHGGMRVSISWREFSHCGASSICGSWALTPARRPRPHQLFWSCVDESICWRRRHCVVSAAQGERNHVCPTWAWVSHLVSDAPWVRCGECHYLADVGVPSVDVLCENTGGAWY